MYPLDAGDELQEFRQSVQRFAETKLLPGYLDRALSDDYPHEQVAQMGGAGLFGLGVPESQGGQGADILSLGVAMEEISYADVNLGTILFLQTVPATLMAQHGSPEVIERWLPGIMTGDIIHSLALTEPGAGSDTKALTCRAERVDSGWRIHGEKTSITQAPVANVATVVAQTDPSLGTKGIGAFVVALDNDETVSRQRFRDPGARPIGRGSLMFDGTFVTDDHVLVQPGGGLHTVLAEFDLTRTLIALNVISAGRRALEMAMAYASERVAFGQPIGVNQGVSFPIAEHMTYLEGIRALAWQALQLRLAGKPHTTEAAMLKWWAPRASFNAINDAVVIHGHVGWSDELPLQAMLRDVSGCQIGDGTPQIQKMIIARDIARRVAGGQR